VEYTDRQMFGCIYMDRSDKRNCYCFQWDEFSISSYPDERSSPGEAMQTAAKRALEEIDIRSKGIGGNVTEDKIVMMSRISQVSTGLEYKIPQTDVLLCRSVNQSYSLRSSLFLIELHGSNSLTFYNRSSSSR
jgi:hypothetical protein